MKRLRGEYMLKPKTRWVLKQQDEQQIHFLAESLGITPLLAALLIRRGLADPDEAREFLYVDEQSFHDPFLFPGMGKAVNRIKEAIGAGEPILIFGDYDADGVTSVAIMMITLQELGARADFYIPNRFTEGYGPNEGAFRHAANQIPLDHHGGYRHRGVERSGTGKRTRDRFNHYRSSRAGRRDSPAEAIIHPKVPEDGYPFQNCRERA